MVGWGASFQGAKLRLNPGIAKAGRRTHFSTFFSGAELLKISLKSSFQPT
jgi:hypothetical protein